MKYFKSTTTTLYTCIPRIGINFTHKSQFPEEIFIKSRKYDKVASKQITNMTLALHNVRENK